MCGVGLKAAPHPALPGQPGGCTLPAARSPRHKPGQPGRRLRGPMAQGAPPAEEPQAQHAAGRPGGQPAGGHCRAVGSEPPAQQAQGPGCGVQPQSMVPPRVRPPRPSEQAAPTRSVWGVPMPLRSAPRPRRRPLEGSTGWSQAQPPVKRAHSSLGRLGAWGRARVAQARPRTAPRGLVEKQLCLEETLSSTLIRRSFSTMLREGPQAASTTMLSPQTCGQPSRPA